MAALHRRLKIITMSGYICSATFPPFGDFKRWYDSKLSNILTFHRHVYSMCIFISVGTATNPGICSDQFLSDLDCNMIQETLHFINTPLPLLILNARLLLNSGSFTVVYLIQLWLGPFWHSILDFRPRIRRHQGLLIWKRYTFQML